VLASLAQRDAENARADAQESEQAALEERDRADTAADEAQTQQGLALAEAAAKDRQATINRVQTLAAEARAAIQTDPELGVLLALEAVGIEVDGRPLEVAVNALHETVSSSRLRLSVPGFQTLGVSGTGEHLATSSAWGGPITVHDAESGDVLLSLATSSDPANGQVDMSVAMSADGSLVATGRTDGTVTVWGTETGSVLWTTDGTGTGHDDAVLVLEFTPDDSALITRSQDQTLRVWDSSDGTQEHVVEAPINGDLLMGMDVSRDGRLVAAACGADVRVVDLATGEVLHRLEKNFEGFFGAVDVAFRPDGTSLVAVDFWLDQNVAVWDLTTETRTTVHSAGEFLRSVAISDDGSLLVTGDDGGGMTVLEASGDGYRRLHELGGHKTKVLHLEFLGSGHSLASVSDEDVRVWDLGVTGTSEWLTVQVQLVGYPSVAFSPDGNRIAAGPVDGGVGIFDTFTGEELATLDTGAWSVKDLAFSPDGTLLAVTPWGSPRGELQVWDTGSGSLVGELGVTDQVCSIDFSPDGELLAATLGMF
jgi:hypothetical protein